MHKPSLRAKRSNLIHDFTAGAEDTEKTNKKKANFGKGKDKDNKDGKFANPGRVIMSKVNRERYDIFFKESVMGKRVTGIIAGLFAMLFCVQAFANGIIIPRPRPHPIPPPRRIVRHLPAWVKEAHLKVTITDQVAKTEVKEVFVNPNNWQLEGDFVFPLPADASVTDFSFWMNGKEVKAELLDTKQARQIYTDIVRRMKDPALLEYVGTKMFRLRIFPIPPNGEAKVKLTYNQVLKSDTGMVTYRYPHSTNKYSSKPLQSATVDVSIDSKVAIKNVYCPSHTVDITRKGDHKVRLSYEGTNVKPEKDFLVYYTLSDKDFGLSFLTYKEKGEDGYFLALLSPKQEVKKEDILPKDIVFVLDTSGSMSGEKIEQARKSLTFCVNSLNKEDRFNIISFATSTRLFKDNPVKADKENVEKARKWIAEITARGGTNINDAILEALAMKGSDERTYMIVFITDGLPTISETDPKKILKNIKKANERRCRLFVFGVGHDVNTILLDKLAEDNRGARDYITPEENIEVKISNFYDKVANPVLADLKLKFEGLETYDVYPRELPDIFKGSQIAVVGRYKDGGHKAVRLTGKVGKKEKEFVYEADFPKVATEAAYVARVWATAKVGYMLDEMRLHGESAEVRKEVVRLAKKFGILTPYTSYLVVEDERKRVARRGADWDRPIDRPMPPGKERDAGVHKRIPAPNSAAEDLARKMDKMKKESSTLGKLMGEAEKPEASGRGAVGRSQAAKKLKDAAKAPATDPGKGITGGRAYGRKEEKELAEAEEQIEEMIKRIGAKTFYLNNGVWVDSEFKEGLKEVKIKYLSDEYFELLAKHPEAAKYFAIDSKVIIVIEGKAYRIIEE